MAPEVPSSAITQYAWADEDSNVKIYIDLDNVGELPKENIVLDFSKTSFSLLIIGYNGGNLKLAFSKTFDDMEEVYFKLKPSKVILTLKKVSEKKWPCINAGTPSK